MRITIGDVMEDFVVSTPYQEHISLSAAMEGCASVLYFLRYYGCTLCQMDMHTIASDYPRYKERGLKVFVVLQSAPETIRKQLSEDYEPFTVICDESLSLYQQLEIEPAKSKEELIGGCSAEKVAQAKRMGFTHGEYEGEEMQLPAVFVLDKNRKVLLSYYGSNAADIPAVDVVLNSVL